MKTFQLLCLVLVSLNLLGQEHKIYVSDAGNFNNPPWQILVFNEDGSDGSVFIITNLNWPQDILFLEGKKEVLISNLGSGCISRHNSETGAFINFFACNISGPTRIKIGPDSLLYVLQWSGNGRVLRYTLDGEALGEFTLKSVSNSIGLDWDADKNLYVSSYNGKFIQKFDSLGNDLGAFISTNLAGPTNILFEESGDLLVSDYNGTAVKRFSASGVLKGNFLSGLGKSEGIDYLPNGNILIGNGATSSVKMFDSSGNYVKDLIPSGTLSLLNPNAVVVREMRSVGIGEDKTSSKPFIYPSMGSVFTIPEGISNRIEKIEIVDCSGKRVKSLKGVNSLNFEELNLTYGTYLVALHLKDADVVQQKVVYQKN